MHLKSYLDPFRHRGFTPVYLAFSISRLGDWIYLVGFSLWLYELTHSAALMALVTAIQTVPRVLLGAVTGAIADRVDRVKLMIFCDLMQALLVLPLLVVKTEQHLPVVYVVAFALALFSAQGSVAKGPLISTLLPRDAIVKGNAVINATESIVMMVGPVISSVAIAHAGYTATFLGNAASFLVSAVLLLPVRQHGATPRTDGSSEEESGESLWAFVTGFFTSVRSPGLLRQLVLVVGLMALGQGTVQALHTPLLIDVIRLTQQQYATVLTLQGVGGIIGSYLVIRLAERLSPRILLGGGLLLAALTTVLLVTYPAYWLVVIITLAEGVFITGIFISIPTLIQQQTADHMMGRAFAAVDTAENGFMLISMTVSGLLVPFASMRVLFVGVAVLFVAGGLLAFRTMHAPKAATASVS